MTLESRLQQIDAAIQHYDQLRLQREARAVNRYFVLYNAGKLQDAQECAPDEIKPYLTQLLQLNRYIDALEMELSEEIILKRLREYVYVGGLQLLSQDVFELVFYAKNKAFALYLLLPAFEESILTLFLQNRHKPTLLDSEALERFLDAFYDYRPVAEQKIADMLQRIDAAGSILSPGGPFYAKYIAQVYEARVYQLSSQYEAMVERYLAHMQDGTALASQEIFPQSEEEISVFCTLLKHMAGTRVCNAYLYALEFLRKPVVKMSNGTLTLPFVAGAIYQLYDLYKLQTVASFVDSDKFYPDAEIQVLQSLRIVGKAESEKIPAYYALAALCYVYGAVVDYKSFSELYELEFQRTKDYFYALQFEQVADFYQLLNKTRTDYAANQRFVTYRVAQIVDNVSNNLAISQQLSVCELDRENLRFSQIAGFVDRVREIVSKEHRGLGDDVSKTAFKEICCKILPNLKRWRVNKTISDNMLDCLRAYQEEYRKVCQQLRCYWMMANFSLLCFEETVAAFSP